MGEIQKKKDKKQTMTYWEVT